jgi:hypothetical protein
MTSKATIKKLIELSLIAGFALGQPASAVMVFMDFNHDGKYDPSITLDGSFQIDFLADTEGVSLSSFSVTTKVDPLVLRFAGNGETLAGFGPPWENGGPSPEGIDTLSFGGDVGSSPPVSGANIYLFTAYVYRTGPVGSVTFTSVAQGFRDENGTIINNQVSFLPTTVHAVPVPGALWLFGPTLVSLSLMACWHQRKRKTLI